jgi:hypothetical protein
VLLPPQAVGIATPAVLTANLAEACNTYITSVVLQHDLVPRFSVYNAYVLKEEMVGLEFECLPGHPAACMGFPGCCTCLHGDSRVLHTAACVLHAPACPAGRHQLGGQPGGHGQGLGGARHDRAQ